MSQFRNESDPRTWLFGILNNKIAEHYRQQSKISKVDLGNDRTLDDFFDDQGNWKSTVVSSQWDTNAQNLFDNPLFIKAFQDCLERLPAEWNRCINLKYLEQRKSKAVCQELGITVTNYWQIMHRAKLQLRRCLETNWFEKDRE